MPASYPASIKSFTPQVDGVDYPVVEDVNSLQDEVTALETAHLSGFEHDLIPQSTGDNRDLGLTGQRWRHLFLSGNLDVSGAIIGPVSPQVVEARITLTTAVAVTTGDVTGATTIYVTPHRGNRVALYTGSAWAIVALSELSIVTSGGTASRPHDVFLDYNDGTPVLAILAWTNATTRATALTTQDGVLVKTGDTQQRYLGSVYLDGSKQAEDSAANRLVFNYYNAVARPLLKAEGTNSWPYTTATYQQANASAANQVSVMVGIAEHAIELRVQANASSDGAAAPSVKVAIGEDATTKHASCLTQPGVAFTTGIVVGCGATLAIIPALGYHYYTWLEQSDAANTTTWYGDNGAAVIQSGISGMWRG